MKKSLLLLALFATLFTYSLNAQVTLTVANGDVTNSYVPIYGYNTDSYLREQVIYPASMLTSMVGSGITSMTFYLSSPPSAAWTSVFDVSLGVTTNSAFVSGSTTFLTDASTSLYQGTLTVNTDKTMTISFNEPFFYVGGNLLLDISTIQYGNYKSATFMGINSSRGSGYGYSGTSLANATYMYVQDFIPKTTFSYLMGDTCMHPFNLSVTDVAGSSAMVRWQNVTDYTPDHYEVSYKQMGTNTWTVAANNVITEYYMVTGLQPETAYQMRVRAFCDATTPTEYSDVVDFTTICSGGYSESVVIGTGTSTNGGGVLPMNMYYKYGYSQQIYRAAELGVARNLNSLSIQYFYASPQTRTFDIYLGNTTKSSFSNNNDWVLANDLTKVFSGTVTFDNTGEECWFSIPFDTVFFYNGTDNLVVVFDDNTGSFTNSNVKFYTHQSLSGSSLYQYSDSNNSTPESPYSGSVNSNRLNLRLPGECINEGCDAANVAVTEVTDHSARLVYTAGVGNNSCEMQYKRSTDNDFIPLPTDGTSYLLIGLNQNTTYIVRIRSHCASGESQWKYTNFTTGVLDLPILYVTENGSGNGSSWATAMGDINEAMSTALVIKNIYGTVPEIWVAQGIYYGDTLAANAFTICQGINVYGGFAGNEPADFDLSQRDFTAHPTILDGRQSRRVLFQSANFSAHTVWDGFTIQNGSTTGNGGGVMVMDMTDLRNCVVRNNMANYGGGIYMYNSNSTKCGFIENCTVTNNIAANAGGIFTRYGVMRHCIVTHNWATASSSYGGGIYAEFVNNSYSTISNCLVANNTAAYGAGIYNNNNCIVENTTVVRNASTTGVAGVNGTPHLHNCIVWGNLQGSVISNVSTSTECAYTAVEGGAPGEGNISLLPESFDNGRYYPYFVQPSLTAGHTDSTENVNWHLQDGSVCVNRGRNEFVTISDSTDLAGITRIQQEVVDMGCYESDYQVVALPNYGNIIYVTVGGAGDHTGTSWSNALGSLSDALSLAQMFNADIWVAEGVYYGDSVSASAFELVDGVSLYGGLVGNEPADYDLSQRDLDTHVTILDGQRSQRLLNQSYNFTNTTVVDGFTIRNGRTTSNGGGANLMKGIVLMNCHFTHNFSQQSGGGVFCSGTNSDSVIIAHCNFTDNRSYTSGGGLACSRAYVTDCVFERDTTSSYQSGYGGAVSASYSRITNCRMSHNYANTNGGGFYSSYASIDHCEIVYNRAGMGGGVYLASAVSDVAVSNCLIANNSATSNAAGIYNYYNNTLNNLTVVCNDITSTTATNMGTAIYQNGENTLTVNNSVFWGNRSNGQLNNFKKGFANSILTLHHCAVEGGYDYGDNIITLVPADTSSMLDPHFVNPALTAGREDVTVNPDWRLAESSPCVNKGDNSMADSLDLDGNTRVQQGVVDLGCYESPYTEIELPVYDSIIYVTEQGAGTRTGENWANALNSIDNAMFLATTNHARVWVAAGTYYGDIEGENAFIMRPGVNVYGGFAGNEPADFDLSQRDFETNTTILDGLSTHRVLYQPDNFTAATAAIWDGFTIQYGWSKENGAGVYLRSYTTLSKCVVQHNTLAPINNSWYNMFRYGGGIYAYGANVTVDGVKQRTTHISQCKIQYNTIQNTNYLDGNGGGVYAEQTDIDHSEICHNTAVTYGGGLHQSGESKVTNCLIHNNSSYRGGGVSTNGTTTFLNCDIVNNRVTNNGGGVYQYSGTPVFTNCIIWGNKKDYIVNNITGSGTYTYCAVEEGRDGTSNIDLASSNDGIDGSMYYVRFNDMDNEDYSLHPTSSCVNVGNSDVMTESLDFYGNPRIYGNIVDIGCSEVQAQSSCPSVLGLQVSNITTNSAQLSWHPTGNENQWIVVYNEVGSNPNTITVSDTVYTLSGLAFNRSYSAKVRAVCDAELMSVFSIPANFQTTCDPTVLDTLSNFGQMLPADSGIVYQNSVSFSWTALPEATSYDFYLWPATSTEPTTPTRSGLMMAGVSNISLPGYERGKFYCWKVVAWNECISKTSPVMTLRVNPKPDLHVTNVTHSNPVASQPMTVTWTVTNDGEGNTPPGQTWNDYIWLVRDADVRWSDPNDVKLATVMNLQSLNAGESYINTATVTIPEGLMGSYYLFVFTSQPDAFNIDFSPTGGFAPDPYTPSVTGNPYSYLEGSVHFNGDVDEVNRHDNFFYVVLNILPPPSADLVVSSVAHPANTFSGNTIPLTWTVTNQGEASALGSWYDVVYLTADTLLNTAEALRVGTYKHTGNLAIDSSYSRTEQVTIPIEYMGEYRFFVMTDNTDLVYEGFGNENNLGVSEHLLTVTLTPPADLIVSNITMTDTVDANGSYQMLFTVKNNGSSPTYGNYWQDAVFISSDPVFDQASARLLTYLYHSGALAADSSYNKAITLGIPVDLTAGTWYLFVKADCNNAIFEYTYEENNVTAHPLTLQLPDLTVSEILVPEIVNPNTITHLTWTVRNNGPGNVVRRSFTDHILFNGELLYSANVTNINLASGDSMVRVANVQLPCTTDGAVLNVITDMTENMLEGDETNNSLSVPLNIHTPDLVVTGVTLSEASLWSGNAVTISYTVINNGDMTATGNITDKIYFSQQATDYQENGLSGQHTYPITLEPNGSKTVTVTVNVPNGISGQYFCHVLCDATNNICEQAATTNNIAHSAAVNVQLSPWPDLVVSQLTVGTPVNLGAPFTVDYTIQNNGTAALNNTGIVQKFYYSTSATVFDTNNLICAVTDYLTLAEGEEVTNSTQMAIPANELQRYYYLHVVTDANDNVYEHTGENNNHTVSSTFLAEVYQLDLTALEIVGPDTVEWGQTIVYQLHVGNNSQVPTLASQWKDAMYLSDDQILQNSDHLLQMVNHRTVLNAGNDYWVNFTLTVPFGTPSTTYLMGYADYNSANPDINHSNNSVMKTIAVRSIPTPDIAVTEVSVIGEVYSGQPARVAYTVTNVGDQEITLQTWSDKLFLSANDDYESSDIELVTKPRYNMTLAQGGSYMDTLTFTIPLPQNGAMYLIVKANSANNPFEANQNNNVVSVPITITLPSPGDLVVTDVICENNIVTGSVLHASWNIKNIGDNNMYGNDLRTLVYISVDTVFDANDRLLGSVSTNDVNIEPDAVVPQTLNCRISGLSEGEYFLIVKTDVTNAFNEVNENNNTSHSIEPFMVTIRPLPFDTDVMDTLYNSDPSDFRLDVGDNLSQTVRIHLTSADSAAGAVNMIYATYNGLGDNLNYSYSTIGQFTANPELFIPSTMAGYYGVNVYGSTPAGDAQNTVIRADILPFELLGVDADHGGNTGAVTVELTGSHFRPDMHICLRNSGDTICADSLTYVNYYKAFAHFDLTGRTPGMYDVSAENFCEGESVLVNGFEIQQGTPDGLAYNLIFPSSPRPNRNIVMMLEFGNNGNLDLHNQVLEITSIGGCPIALTPESVTAGETTLMVPLNIEGQPQGLLRPGSYGTINIYGYTSGGLVFTIKPVNE